MYTTNNADVYQRITDYVINQLEKGEVIWQKGWNTLGLPENISTNHHYKGWNVYFLNFITAYNKFKTPFFITYKQSLDKGGTIRRGEKGFQVVWWATIEDKRTPINKDEEPGIKKIIRVPKVHTVFNVDQTHGIEFRKVEKLYRSSAVKINACENILKNMPSLPSIKHHGDEAYYDPSRDCITMPPIEIFNSDEAYYKTLFHELAHSTGHSKRLNRKELVESDGFGKENYSREELTAELTAAFLCAICGLAERIIKNSAAYIQGWLKALKNDKRLILKAATQAQAAADYIMNNIKESILIN